MITRPSAGSGCGDEWERGTELPWSKTEELLTVQSVPPMQFDAPRPKFEVPHGVGFSTTTFFLVVIAIAFAFVIAFDHYCSSQRSRGFLDKDPNIAAGFHFICLSRLCFEPFG